MIEYWYKAWKHPICATSTKPYFWKSETSLETLQKLSSQIGVNYKLDVKCVKSLNRDLWGIEHWYKVQKRQILSESAKSCFWKMEESLKTFQNLSFYLLVTYKFILKSIKSLNSIFWWLNIGIKLRNKKIPKLVDKHKTISLGIRGKCWNFAKRFSSNWNQL